MNITITLSGEQLEGMQAAADVAGRPLVDFCQQAMEAKADDMIHVHLSPIPRGTYKGVVEAAAAKEAALEAEKAQLAAEKATIAAELAAERAAKEAAEKTAEELLTAMSDAGLEVQK